MARTIVVVGLSVVLVACFSAQDAEACRFLRRLRQRRAPNQYSASQVQSIDDIAQEIENLKDIIEKPLPKSPEVPPDVADIFKNIEGQG